MSLIQEALRRQREEGSTDDRPKAPASVTAPAPVAARTTGPSRPPPLPSSTATGTAPAQAASVPVVVPEPAGEPRQRPWLALAAIVFVVLILTAGGIWLLLFALSQWHQAQKSQTLATQPAAAVEAPVAAVTPVQPVAALPGPGPVAPAPTPPPSVGPTPEAPPATPPPVGIKPAPPADIAPAPAPTDVTPWPALRVTGVVGKGLRGAATINNRIVVVGETVEGVEVLAVGEYGAKLEYNGETRFVKVGSSTE